MARAIIEILGDASSAKLAAKETSAVYQTLERDTKQLAVSAQKSAQLQVEASLRKTSRLRAEIAAYAEIGAAAKIGSREQVAAAELAARAQSRLGKVTGVRAAVTPLSSARLQVRATQEQIDALHAESSAYRQVAAAAKTGSREQIIASDLAAKAQARAAALVPHGRFGTSAARAQVLASVKETEVLRSEAAAYGRVAAAAKHGSQEQIIAAERAASAQARLRALSPKQQLSPGGAARVNVLESVKQTEALRAEALAYREVAAAAEVGSREQITAAQLASRAERRLAGSLGVSASEQRAFARSASGAERSLGRATRGALAGSGIFRGLGRSIAFASGGFLAFATAGQFIRTSIDAAKGALVTQRQLGRQLQNDGRSFKDYRGEIDRTNLRLSALSGFTKDDLDQSLTTILRTTSNVSKALRDNALAANIARARHIGLSQAALVVAKTEAGNTTLLRRQGFQISKNATVEQALAIVRAKVAGQAKAGTTQQERFGAVLHDSEVIIGAGLLPTLNRYLASGAQWLSQMNQSGRLQRDVAKASDDLRGAIGGIKAVLSPVVGAFKLLGRVSGGTENEVKGLGTAFLILEGRAKLIRWGLISTGIEGVGTSALIASGEVATLRTRLLGLSKLGPIAVAVALSFIPKAKASANPNAPSRNPVAQFFAGLPVVGGAFSQANVAADKIDKKLGLLPAPPKRFIPPLPGLNPATRGLGPSTHGNPFGELKFGDPTIAARKLLNQTFAQAKLLNPSITRKTFELGRKVAQAYIDGINKPKGGVTLPSPKTPKGLSLTGRFNIAELKLARAQLTATSSDDIAILKTEASIVRQQIAGTKILKDKTALTQQLVGIMGQLKSASKAASDSFTIPDKLNLLTARASTTPSLGDDAAAARATKAFIRKAIASGKLRGKALIDANNQLGQINSQIASAADQARQDQQKRVQDRLARRSARQFKALGLDATGQPLTPGTRVLHRELAKVSDAITGTFLDTRKERSVLQRIRTVLSGQLGAVTKDVRSQVKQMLDDIDQQLKDHQQGPNTAQFVKARSATLLAGLRSLNAPDRRALEARLSQLGAGGTLPGKGTAAFGFVVPAGDNVIHTHVHLDGKQVALSTTRHQQKARRRNSSQRRGPHAGGGL